MGDRVTPDGSPVDVYLALPPGETPGLIDSQMGTVGSILELGSGPGRITHPLIAIGHTVVAVDDSPEALEHVHGAERLLADIYTLDLGRTFDAVVAGSHLINAPDRARRMQLLGVCSRHVRPGGVVLIERYEPGWARSPRAGTSTLGEVVVEFEPIDVSDIGFTGRVTYTLGPRSWSQEFKALVVDDADLVEDAGHVGLAVTGWLGEDRTWARLEPRSG